VEKGMSNRARSWAAIRWIQGVRVQEKKVFLLNPFFAALPGFTGVFLLIHMHVNIPMDID
jgi:hypothetical protein